MAPFESLPIDCVREIMLAASKNVGTLTAIGSLGTTCRSCRDALAPCVWERMTDTVLHRTHMDGQSDETGRERFVRSWCVFKKRCYFCNRDGLRRLYHEFGGMYVCQDCMLENTILAHYLYKAFGFPKEEAYKLRHVKRDFYGGRYCHVTMHIVLLTDAEAACIRLFGKTLSDRYDEIDRLREVERDKERAKEAARLLRATVYTGYIAKIGLQTENVHKLPTFKYATKFARPPVSEKKFCKESLPRIREELETYTTCADWVLTKEDTGDASKVFKASTVLFPSNADTQLQRMEDAYLAIRKARDDAHRLQNPEHEAVFLEKSIRSIIENCYWGRFRSNDIFTIDDFMRGLYFDWVSQYGRWAQFQCKHCTKVSDANGIECHIRMKHRFAVWPPEEHVSLI
jgi:hypothetical protein